MELNNSSNARLGMASIKSPSVGKLTPPSSTRDVSEDRSNQGQKIISNLSHGDGPQLASIPSFVSFHSHRQWQLQHMAAVFRHWHRQNYVFGISGHISVRDAQYTNAFWTNPLGVHFGLLRASDMILLSLDGTQLHPPVGGAQVLESLQSHPTSQRAMTRPANAAGFLIHAALHKRRADVHAACHAHTPHGRAYSAFAKPLDILTQDICKFYNRHAVYENYGGVVLDGTAEEGEHIADALGEQHVGLILRNHGLLTVGQTVDEAAWLFDVLEAGCRDQLLIDSAERHSEGQLQRKIIGDAEAQYNLDMEGTAEVCYAEFQAYYEYEEAMCNGDFKN